VTSLSILTNHFTKKNKKKLMLPSVVVASAQMMVQCGAVRGRNGRRKKHAARRTLGAARCAAPTAPTNVAQNVVPSEKWQLGHCAA
jgi:hypothetical protein